MYRDDAGQPFVLPSNLKAELSIIENNNQLCAKCDVCTFPRCGGHPDFHYEVDHHEQMVLASKRAFKIPLYDFFQEYHLFFFQEYHRSTYVMS